jgi:hypothetical protein
MLMVPFSSTNDNEEDEDESEKGVDDRPLRLKGVTMAAFTWTIVCGSKARTGFTVQLIGELSTPHDQYGDATAVVQDGVGVVRRSLPSCCCHFRAFQGILGESAFRPRVL